LTSSLNPSTYGQSVTFTVAVTPQSGSGTPTGTVTLKNGATAIGSITLSNGAGSFHDTSLPAGRYRSPLPTRRLELRRQLRA
jgi:hypothetical protein